MKLTCVLLVAVFASLHCIESIKLAVPRAIAASILSFTIGSSAIADTLTASTAIADTLTASSVIEMDKQPKVDSLKDMLFVLKLEKEFVDKKDYRTHSLTHLLTYLLTHSLTHSLTTHSIGGFRSQLRSFPISDLRTTCRGLKPYLKNEQLQNYNKAYTKMIDNMDYMDSLALKRTQSQGAIKEDVDNELLKALDNSIESFQGMLDGL
jgi:hypothetical protein